MTADTIPAAATEIRMTTLHATRGKNFWSLRPVTRMDLVVGEFDRINSADVPGTANRLLTAMPGLVELQSMMGHEVGFGRTRGGDADGEYTLVFEHRHEQVGLRAAALALETVQQAFDGTLDGVSAAVAELAALATHPDTPPLHGRVFCGISGGEARSDTQALLRQRMQDDEALIIDVAPGYLLQAGLPYARSNMAVILDTTLPDVPERYQKFDNAVKLMNVLCDAVVTDGMVICPAKAWEIQDYARDSGARIGVFSADRRITSRDARDARAIAWTRNGHIMIEGCGPDEDFGPLDPELPPQAQVAAALAAAARNLECRR
jgi:cyanophycin synthetase